MGRIRIIDPILLNSMLAVAESGSFTKAGERLSLTQSAISQHIRRLEEEVGYALFDRSGRYVRTTEEGERLLGYARKVLGLMGEALDSVRDGHGRGEIKIGVPEDFASGQIAPTLARFSHDFPGIRLEVTSGLSKMLWQQFCNGEHDLVLVKQRPGAAPAEAAWPEPLAWVDSKASPSFSVDPLPLVVFPPGGLYRDEMIHAVESCGRRWRVSFSSSSLASVCTAVSAGLGISLIPRRLAGPEHRLLMCEEGFPKLLTPIFEIALHYKWDANSAVVELGERLKKVCFWATEGWGRLQEEGCEKK